MVAKLKTAERYIKKHHASIHCATSLTLLQRKIGNCLLFKAYHNLLTQDFHYITIQELMVLLEIKGKDYQKLKDGVCKLMSTVIEWDVVKTSSSGALKNFESNDETWEACTLLSSVKIEGSLIRYEYSRTLCERLYRPSNYTQVKLSVQNKFKSNYALILYENGLRYINIGVTGWVSMKLFRKIMGVEDSQYIVFRDFNRRVLMIAISEINKHSDISIDFEVKKVNRVPFSIRFFVRKSSDTSKEDEAYGKEKETLASEQDSMKIMEKLSKYRISKTTVAGWFEKYEEPYILEKVKLVENSSSEIKNVGGFLSSALKNDFMKPVASLTSFRDDRKEQAGIEKLKLQGEISKENYQNYIDETFRQWISELSCNDRVNLRVELKNYLEKEGRLIPLSKTAKKHIDSDEKFVNRGVFQILKIFANNFNDSGVLNMAWKFPKVLSFDEFSVCK